MKTFALFLSLMLLAVGCMPIARVPSPPSPTPPEVKQAFRFSTLQMVDPVVGWATGGGKVLTTGDGGNTWIDVTPPDSGRGAGDAAAHFRDRNTAWLAFPSTDGQSLRIYRTVDGGRIWETSAVAEAGQASFTFADARNGWLLVRRGLAMGSMPVTVWRTEDGGATWQRVAVSEGPDNPGSGSGILPFGGVKTGITFRDPNGGWVTMESRELDQVLLFHSEDGGHTWNAQGLPVPAAYRQHSLTIYPPRS